FGESELKPEAFAIETKDLAGFARTGEARADLGLSNDRRIAFSAGGIPLKRYGHIVGAIGVCGCNSYDNQMVAEAGARPLTGEYGSTALRPCLNAEPAVRRNTQSQIARLGNRSGVWHQPCHQSMV